MVPAIYIITFTVIVDWLIIYISYLYMETKRMNNRKKFIIQSKQLRIIDINCLEDNDNKVFKNCCKLPFLDQFRKNGHEIVICTTQLPPRLHGGEAQGQQPDHGEAVFPGLVFARLTEEGLMIQVPDLLLDPNNRYTAIIAQIQRPIENNREAGAGEFNRGRSDNRDGTDYRNRPDNRDGMDVRGVAEASGNMRGIISVKVRYRGSDIIFQVQKGMLVADFVRSDDFIKRVKDEWNILEADLQNMVLRHQGGHVVEKLEISCILRLELGLFCEQWHSNSK